MRARTTGCTVLAATLLLAGCAAQAEQDQVAASDRVEDLRKVDWQLQSLVRDGATPTDLEGNVAVLRVAGDDHVSGRSCNSWGGPGQIAPGAITVRETSTTLVGCTGIRATLDDVAQEVLRAGASFVVDDGTLTLTSGETTLTYRPQASPWSNPDAATLVEGAFGDAVYRLSWEHDGGNIGVSWESRDQAGVGLGGSGIGRSVTEDITYLDPSGQTVAGRGFVYVPAPLDVDRIAWVRGGSQVQLRRYPLSAAKTWHLFAGFVDGPTMGGEAVGYSKGQEVLRSRVLPY